MNKKCPTVELNNSWVDANYADKDGQFGYKQGEHIPTAIFDSKSNTITVGTITFENKDYIRSILNLYDPNRLDMITSRASANALTNDDIVWLINKAFELSLLQPRQKRTHS